MEIKWKNNKNIKGKLVNLVPKILCVFIFISGMILLFTGALNPGVKRLVHIEKLYPLELIEFSHFLGSIIGVLLLILAYGIRRKIDIAFYITTILLILGIITLIFKGLYHGASIFLSLTLILLVISRKYFYRRSKLIDERFKGRWLIYIFLIIILSIILGIIVHNDEMYSDTLWWKFVANKNYPRFLRASLGSVVIYITLLIVKIFEGVSTTVHINSQDTMVKIKKALEYTERADSYLVFLNDKKVIFSEKEDTFIMYAECKNSNVAFGDPVGNMESFSEVILKFYQMCKSEKKQCVFYEISNRFINNYLEIGLNFIKIGEEGVVELEKFSLDGGVNKNLRTIYNRLKKSGLKVEFLEKERFSEYKERLKEISEQWLLNKNSSEKGFSLGKYDEDYLSNFNFVIVKMNEEILGFATLFETESKEELSLDLMRYAENAPSNLMEYLFINVIYWGKERGYKRFSLGMAPLSGINDSEFASTWNKVGSLIYRHGGNFYNFEGLKFFKNKFKPTWTPRYIAFSGLFSIPYVLKDITLLISNGVKKLLIR